MTKLKIQCRLKKGYVPPPEVLEELRKDPEYNPTPDNELPAEAFEWSDVDHNHVPYFEETEPAWEYINATWGRAIREFGLEFQVVPA